MGIRMGCGHFLKKKFAVYRLTYRKFAKIIIIALNRPWWKDRESVKLNKPMERWSVQYLYLDINRMFNYNTIRLGVFADSLNDPDNEELTRRFRGWFDI